MNVKTLLKHVFQKLGLNIHRYHKDDQSDRGSIFYSMQTAAAIGFYPKVVLDVGAARGGWATKVSKVWPEARYILIDPIVENEIELRKISRTLGNAEYRIALAMDAPGLVYINIHPDPDGSSVFRERESNINGHQRQVEAVTLDSLSQEMGLKGPFLIKADVQGAELKVLEGAGAILSNSELLVLEVTLFDIYQGKGPQLFEVVSFLKSKGFVVWDIFDHKYRMVDSALCQVDMAFVREDCVFRKWQQYATEDQRRDQLTMLEKNHLKGC